MLFGLCGLRADAGNALGVDGLTAADFTQFTATLPEGWDEVQVGALTLGGVRYGMNARHGAKALLTPLPIDQLPP